MAPHYQAREAGPELNLLVLPNLVPGESGLLHNRLPFIYLERQGMWVDVSKRDTLDLAELRERIARELDQLMTRLDREPGADLTFALKAFCLQLYRDLIPRRLEPHLKALAAAEQGPYPPRLNIHSSLEWIPWELLFDGENFLGLRFQIARLPILTSEPGALSKTHIVIHSLYNLLGQHVLGDPEMVEWQQTFPLPLGAAARAFQYPDHVRERGFPGLADLEQIRRPGILHFTCHGGLESGSGSVYWSLNERAPIPEMYRITREVVDLLAETIQLRASNPLVFGNTCSSLRAWQNAPHKQSGLMLGFGPAFLARGTSAFVGTFAPVTKTAAVHFARRFYHYLLGKNYPLGAALWLTKNEFAEQASRDPSYLFYTLYGPAGLTFEAH